MELSLNAGQKSNTSRDFLVLWLALILIMFPVLHWLGVFRFDSEMLKQGSAVVEDQGNAANVALAANSVYKDYGTVVIDKIGLRAPIVLPASKNYGVLKSALEQGIVHYPDSALPGQDGNVFLFGHSSSRIFETNPNYKVFNRVQDLKSGDIILIQANGKEFRYQVSSVKIMQPNETKIYFASTKPMLTLSTCWPIGDPKNRTVVEAEFLGQAQIYAD